MIIIKITCPLHVCPRKPHFLISSKTGVTIFSYFWSKHRFFTTHSGPQHIQQMRDRPRSCTTAAKNRVLASIQARCFSLFMNTPKSLNNEKRIIQKSLHPQFGHCMAKEQLIKSHYIAKYSRKVILSCDKRRLIDAHF